MKRFELLKQTRQSTEYSCGASALQTVLSYWGWDVDEAELMQLLHTTPETGTYPEDIVRVARALRFDAEIKENLTLEEIEQATAVGNPVIILGQAWQSRKDSDQSAACVGWVGAIAETQHGRPKCWVYQPSPPPLKAAEPGAANGMKPPVRNISQ
jgi:hypothetical protein